MNGLTRGCGFGLVTAGLLAASCVGCGSGGPMTTAEKAEAAAAAEEAATRPVGVDLGSFEVREYHPIEGQQSALRFALYASVQQQEVERFERLLEHRRNKIRDEVVTAARIVPRSDFDDPQLANLQRRILLRLQRSTPELAIERIFVTDYSLSLD